MTGNKHISVSGTEQQPRDEQSHESFGAENVISLLQQIEHERLAHPPSREFDATVEFGTTSLEDLITDAASNSVQAINPSILIDSKRSPEIKEEAIHEQTGISEQTETAAALPELAAVKVFFGDDEGAA